MPVLSNGNELSVWEDVNNESPDAILFTITDAAGGVVGPIGAQPDYFFGSVDVASVDVFDGFFTVTSFTNDGRNEIFSRVETHVFDNEGNYIRTLSAQAAYLSTGIVSVTAQNPDDITVTYTGANEYFGGGNTQYGQHQIILSDGVVQPDTFINHAPTVMDLTFTLSTGEILDDIKFSATDKDFDLLSFVILDGPDNGSVEQETRFEPGSYPFPQGEYGGSVHYHQDFLKGNFFDYLPDAGFTGTDTFTVYATDGQGNSNVATITITIAPPAQSLVLTDGRDAVSYKAYEHAVIVDAKGGSDRIIGSKFDDIIDGNKGNDDLRGDRGDDVLTGGQGNDHLSGGAGHDVLSGGFGLDLLRGGEGEDTFVFDVAPRAADLDWIIDFRSADDELRLDNSVFGGLVEGTLDANAFITGKAAMDADDRIIFNKNTGVLSYDVDGVGGQAAVKFAMVTFGTSLAAGDFFIV